MLEFIHQFGRLIGQNEAGRQTNSQQYRSVKAWVNAHAQQHHTLSVAGLTVAGLGHTAVHTFQW